MDNIFLDILSISVFFTGLLWISEKFFNFKKNKNIFQSNIELQKKNYILNNNKTYKKSCKLKNIKSLFPILLLVFIIRCFFYEPFYIPSESMMPTLLPGDYIIVKKYFYGIKNPITNNILVKYHSPKRGDIIALKDPKNSRKNFVKRIIGLPGDKVVYDSINKILTIYSNYNTIKNNKKISFKQYVFEKYNTNSVVENKKMQETVSDVEKFNSNDNILNYNCMIYKEILDHYKYNILISHANKNTPKLYFHQDKQPTGTWIIPPKNYFVLGDNRDNSCDSRYWGFVPENKIIGKVDYIWMSLEKKVGKWPTGINLHRIGTIN
ncbi:Signal peptidase I [Buchnera aphidicola (Takecallis arundicolens)]|uniref:signal peptidase I n=1 Tax=Buchnera aphidicola TaxID=9 RepID=UPI003463F8DC